MPRFTPSSRLDTASLDDGDRQFRGVIERGEPDAVPPGFLRSLTNGTCRDGTARNRAGSSTPTTLQPTGNPALFGHGIFSDPIGTEWLLVAAADGIWRLRDGHTPTRIPVPETIAAPVRIVQAFRKVQVFRGSTLPPWEWDGDLLGGFEAIDQTPDGITVPIPNGPDRAGLLPVLIQNRQAIPHGRSELAITDIFDFTRIDPIYSDFNVTGGTDDQLTGLFRYDDSTLIIGNEQSIQQLSGITGDLSTLRLDPLSDEIGVKAGGTMRRFMGDLHWLADGGVYALKEVEQRVVADAVPLSDDIEPTMERINWDAAAGSVAAVWDKTYFLAVPLESSTRNNVILPYDSKLRAWQGVHTLPSAVRVEALVKIDWHGRKRLFAIDYATGRVHLLYEGRYDYIGNTRTDIPCSRGFRAYGLELPERKRFRRLRIYYRTWASDIATSVATDGVNETQPLLSKTHNRAKYTIFPTDRAPADYHTNNTNDDHAAPYREDYSVDWTTPADPGENGIDPDLEQSHRAAFTLKERGSWAAPTVTSTTGTLTVVKVVLEGAEGDKADRGAP